MKVYLQTQGYTVNRKRVQRLMRQLGLQAIYPKPKLSESHAEHQELALQVLTKTEPMPEKGLAMLLAMGRSNYRISKEYSLIA